MLSTLFLVADFFGVLSLGVLSMDLPGVLSLAALLVGVALVGVFDLEGVFWCVDFRKLLAPVPD